MVKFKNYFFDPFLIFFSKSYQLSRVDDSSLKKTPLVVFRGYQLFIYVSYFICALFFLFFALIAYTPVGGFLPKNIIDKRGELIELIRSVDSLEHNLKIKSQYIDVINNIISGNVLDSSISIGMGSEIVFEDLSLSPSKEDSALRKLVTNEDFYNIPVDYSPSYIDLEDFVFFKPSEGLITSGFDPAEGHFGVDIVGNTNASVKATLDGVVVFSDWSVSSGHTILIQHAKNIISVYMHNSSVTKNINDLVLAGEVVGIIGNSGEGSSGPHLHFELWQNGSPVNPLDYIDF